MAVVAIPTAAAVLMYRALAHNDITIFEILPDSPSEKGPKPAIKDQTTRTKHDASSLAGQHLRTPVDPLDLTPTHEHSNTKVPGAIVPLLVDKSNPDRLRLQARRELMRPGALHGLESD